MDGWHHRLDGHESEWTPGVGDGQGGLASCDSWGRKESETTEGLNRNKLKGVTWYTQRGEKEREKKERNIKLKILYPAMFLFRIGESKEF